MRRVRSALAAVPTIYAVGDDIDRDEIYVSYDAAAGDAAAVAPGMVAVVKAAGYDAWLKGPSWPAVAPEPIVLPMP